MRTISLFVSIFYTMSLHAQDLREFNDDFTTNTLQHWKSFHQQEGWPDFAKEVHVNANNSGVFYLEPEVGFWYGEIHAGPYYFKELPKGDFTVVTKVKVEGRNTSTPSRSFSLAGLMLRAKRPVNVAKTVKGHENWLFMSTGYAKGKNRPQFETKVTVNGKSKLKIYPATAGWVELAIMKQGSTFKLGYKKEGTWTVVRTIENAQMNTGLQVGFIAYTDFNGKMKRRYIFNRERLNNEVFKDGQPDVKASFDYIKFYSTEELSF